MFVLPKLDSSWAQNYLDENRLREPIYEEANLCTQQTQEKDIQVIETKRVITASSNAHYQRKVLHVKARRKRKCEVQLPLKFFLHLILQRKR